MNNLSQEFSSVVCSLPFHFAIELFVSKSIGNDWLLDSLVPSFGAWGWLHHRYFERGSDLTILQELGHAHRGPGSEFAWNGTGEPLLASYAAPTTDWSEVVFVFGERSSNTNKSCFRLNLAQTPARYLSFKLFIYLCLKRYARWRVRHIIVNSPSVNTPQSSFRFSSMKPTMYMYLSVLGYRRNSWGSFIQ